MNLYHNIYRKDQIFFLEEIFFLIMPFCLMRHNKSPLTKEIRGRRAQRRVQKHTQFYTFFNRIDTIFNFVFLKIVHHFQKIFSIANNQQSSFIQYRRMQMFKNDIYIHCIVFLPFETKFKYKLMWTRFNDFFI